MREDRRPWPERLAEAEARLAAEAAMPPPPDPEDLEVDAIAAALVGRVITGVETAAITIFDDYLGRVTLTLNDGSTVSIVSRMSLDEGWLSVERVPPA